MHDLDRFRLVGGPYLPPPARRGDTLVCEYRGEEVKVGGLTDAPIQWPRVLKTGRASLVVCGDLLRALETESAVAICHHWGVNQATVWKWRKSLGISAKTEGRERLYREYVPEKITGEAYAKMAETHRTPELREKHRQQKLGKPMHPNTAKGLLKAVKRKKSKAHRRAMAAAQAKRWAQVPRPRKPVNPEDRPWTPREDRMLGKTLDRVVAEMLGRTIEGVRGRRQALKIPESRHSALAREPKPTKG